MTARRKKRRGGRVTPPRQRPRTTVGVDPHEAMLAAAIASHRRGETDAAEQQYREILAHRPADPGALHFLGLLEYQRGNREVGISGIERAIASSPDYGDAHNNLGNILMAEDRLADAERCYRQALRCDPGAVNPKMNLGVLSRARQDYDGAETWYRRALRAAPDSALAHLNLAHLLEATGRYDEALAAYGTARDIGGGEVDIGHIMHRSASLLHRLGRPEDARAAFEAWLERDPGHPTATHMLAALTGVDVPERPTPAYVRTLFDGFAGSFDEVLDDLGYLAPGLVAEMIERWTTASAPLAVLDAGCGTGLCAPMLRPIAEHLEGVDLSPRMLERARSRGLYDVLVEADLVGHLAAKEHRFDLIVAADTFCYFGALDGVFATAHTALRPSGQFVFTVEHSPESPAQGYVLHPHGRYGHRESYVREALARAGFLVDDVLEADLRSERGEPVGGLVVAARPSPEQQ